MRRSSPRRACRVGERALTLPPLPRAGYGKEFRERLAGQWGVVDIKDTIACVEYLIKEGKVDKEKVAITGGSAGPSRSLSSSLSSLLMAFSR